MHLTLHSQVLSGTDPFPEDSDEVILDRITAGVRPGWPLDPSKLLADELRELIEACWNQEPNERPTVSKVLQILTKLGGAQNKEQATTFMEDPDDDVLMRGWEHIPKKGALESAATPRI